MSPLPARRLVPERARRAVRNRLGAGWPPVGFVRFGSLRRLEPVTRTFGFERGQPIDRHYIEKFLGRYSGAPGYARGDVRGRVLEIGDDTYTRRFGADVDQVDVLHADESNPAATIVGDLASGSGVPSDTFDCVICTQTLQFVYDVRGAVETLHRALRPGGVVLATAHGIGQISRPDQDHWGEYWRLTSRAARRLFEEAFPPENVTVESYGNVLATTAFLYGLAAEDLRRAELDLRDPDYELLVAIRAVKAG
jgi:SAM-dependent methyltransferase